MIGALDYAKARAAIQFEDSYSRLGKILELRPLTAPIDWWRLLGDEWTGCDNIAEFRSELRGLLRTTHCDLLRQMMRPPEADRLATLPDMLTVYRGCYHFNRHGLSWTLDRAIAKKFITLNRYRRATYQPLLVTGRVRRDKAVLKDDRSEQEIVCAHVRLIGTELIPLVRSATGDTHVP